jgi:hypothetical protein
VVEEPWLYGRPGVVLGVSRRRGEDAAEGGQRFLGGAELPEQFGEVAHDDVQLPPQRGDADQDVSFVAVGAVPEDHDSAQPHPFECREASEIRVDLGHAHRQHERGRTRELP